MRGIERIFDDRRMSLLSGRLATPRKRRGDSIRESETWFERSLAHLACIEGSRIHVETWRHGTSNHPQGTILTREPKEKESFSKPMESFPLIFFRRRRRWPSRSWMRRGVRWCTTKREQKIKTKLVFFFFFFPCSLLPKPFFFTERQW